MMNSANPGDSRIPRKTPLNPLAPLAHSKKSTNSNPQSQKKTTLATKSTHSENQHCHNHINNGDTVDDLSKGSQKCQTAFVKEENAAIRKSLQKFEEDHRKMKGILEGTVREAEEKLNYMKELLEKSNQIHMDEVELLSSKNKVLENHVEEFDKKLTGNKDSGGDEGSKTDVPEDMPLERRQKVSKERLKAFREKLQEMNHTTQSYLTDVQRMRNEIEEIEGISLRISSANREDDDDEKVDTNSNSRSQNPQRSDVFFITETSETE